jgi:hypothetical protein
MAATEEWRRCRWCFPPLQRLTRSDGLGFGVSVGRTAADEPWRPCPGPHLFYMALATGAHQPYGLGAPDQGARSGRATVGSHWRSN